MKNIPINEKPRSAERTDVSSQNIQTKPVVVQLPISLYEGRLYVVESELQLPQDYQPAVGSFFIHDVLPGRLSVHWWGFDARDQKIYMCLSVGYSDSTRTIDEWIAENPEWHVTENPLVVLESDDGKHTPDD